MPISFSARVSVPDHVLKRELDGEAVILNLDSECYFGLNDVATRMLGVLSKEDSIQKAYEVLLETFDVEPDVLRKDLQSLIENMLEKGLVVLNSNEKGS